METGLLCAVKVGGDISPRPLGLANSLFPHRWQVHKKVSGSLTLILTTGPFLPMCIWPKPIIWPSPKTRGGRTHQLRGRRGEVQMRGR